MVRSKLKNKAILYVIFIAVVVAIFAGFYASSRPDGLEKVAGNLKFEEKAKPATGVFIDYTVSFITHPSFSTVIAGIFGIIIIYFLFRSIARVKYIGELIKRLFSPH